MADEDFVLESKAEPEVQAKAKELGWIPPERYKGEPDRFIDADEFVRRGEEILPIVKARNAKLESQLAQVSAQLKEQAEILRANKESMDAMEKFHAEDTQRKVALVRKQLKEQIASASKDGDHEALAEATSQLSELDATVKVKEKEEEDAKARAKASSSQQTQEYTPVFQEWLSRNSWYGKDTRRTAYANAYAAELRRAGDSSTEGEFLAKLEDEVEERFGGSSTSSRREDPASGGRGGTRRGGGKSYSDLPADAKEACDSYTRQLVGKGRKFETVDAWRKHYAKTYFEDQ